MLAACVALVSLLAFDLRPLSAQDSPEAPAVREEAPLHFRDKDGRLVPVPGLDLEQLKKLIEMQRLDGGGALQPQYTLYEVRLSAQVVEDDVRIQAEFELGARGDRWLRVPLRLGECALTEPPQHAGRDEFLHFNDEKGGYDWWIRPRPPAAATAGTNGAGASSSVAPASDPTEAGPTPEPASPTQREAESPSGAAPAGSGGANSGMGMGMGMAMGSAMNAAIGNGAAATPTEGEQRFRLALHLVMPVEHVGGERRLRLTAPRSNRSQLRLTVPGDQALGTLLGARLAEAPTAEKTNSAEKPAPADGAGAVTHFQLHGLDGQCVVSWRERAQRLVQASSNLRAEGWLKCRFDAKDRIVYTDATFTVRSFGGEFEGFRLRLPPEAQLSKDDPRFRDLEPAATGSGLGDVLHVRHDRTAEPVVVRIETQRYYGSLRPNDPVEVAGFEVLGAVRQYGYIALQIEEGWQFQWSRLERTLEQISVSRLPETMRSKEITAAFEYSRQPVSLKVQVFRPDSRVRVEPEYDVLVSPDEVELEARLKYTIDRAKRHDLQIDLADWEIDRLEPTELIDDKRLRLDQRTPLTVPLKQSMDGTFEIRIAARRKHPPDATSVAFALPRPEAQAATQQVRVESTPNVLLIPRTEAIVGMVRQHAVDVPSEAFQQAFDYQADSTQARFVADFRVNPRRISVRGSGEITYQEARLRVDQQLDYTVEFEPLTELVLEVPQALSDSETLEFHLEGQRVQGTPLPASESSPEEPVRWRFSVPAEHQMGSFRMSAGFWIAHDRLPHDQSLATLVPLVSPADGQLLGNRLWVAADLGIDVQHRGGGWTAVGNLPPQQGRRGVAWEANHPTNEILLIARREGGQVDEGAVVDRAWIQSFFGEGVREDWLQLRIRSSNEILKLRLPESEARVLRVLVDGLPAQTQVQDDLLAVAWRGSASPVSRLLQVQYRVPFELRPAMSRMAMEPMWLEDEAAVDRVYWQVFLTRDRHLLWTGEGWNNELRWRWHRFLWEREPLISQAELQRWMDAPGPLTLPSSANAYAFSRLGAPPQLELGVAQRTWIVGSASLAAMGVCLLWMFAPWLRRPALLLVCGAVLLTLAAAYPQAALLLAQAAGIGLVCGLSALLLRRLLAAPRPQPAPLVASPSSITAPASGQRKAMAAGASTLAVPVGAEVEA